MKKVKLISLVFVFAIASIIWAQTNERPDWYDAPTMFYKEYGTSIIVGTGQAKGTNPGLTEKRAFAAAQANAAEQIANYVQSSLEDYAEEVEMNETSQTMASSKNIIVTVSEMKLTYAKTIKKHVASDGTYYIAVMVDEDRAIKQAAKLAEAAAKKEAAYSNYTATKAEEDIREQVDQIQSEAVAD